MLARKKQTTMDQFTTRGSCEICGERDALPQRSLCGHCSDNRMGSLITLTERLKTLVSILDHPHFKCPAKQSHLFQCRRRLRVRSSRRSVAIVPSARSPRISLCADRWLAARAVSHWIVWSSTRGIVVVVIVVVCKFSHYIVVQRCIHAAGVVW